MAVSIQPEQHIEVHKFYSGAIVGTAFLALVLQAFLPKYFPRTAELMDLPLLVTLYFGLSRRNPSTGLLLGLVIGLAQDGLSGRYIGLFGIAKTMVGYAASSIGARLDVDHPFSRFLLGFGFFLFHHAVYEITQRLLLNEPAEFYSPDLLLAAAVNAVLAVVLFSWLDRLRRS